MNSTNKNALLTVLKDDTGVINKIGFYSPDNGGGFHAVADPVWTVGAGELSDQTGIDFTGAVTAGINISKIALFSTDVVGTTFTGTPISGLTLADAVEVYDMPTTVFVEEGEVLRLTNVEFGIV